MMHVIHYLADIGMQITTTIIHANRIGFPDCTECEFELPNEWITCTGVMKGNTPRKGVNLVNQAEALSDNCVEGNHCVFFESFPYVIIVSKETTSCSWYRFPAC
jgi:hypothetical protein